MVAISETTTAYQKALLIASGPAMLAKMVRPLKDTGLSVNACESFEDAQRLYDQQALVVLPLRDDGLDDAAKFIGWLRDDLSQPSPYILGVGRCPDGQRQGLVAKMRLNDLITLPFTEEEVKDRLASYRRWCHQPDESDSEETDTKSGFSGNVPAELEKTAKVSLFANTGEGEEEETPEAIYCRECPVGIAMFDQDLCYLLANPRWIQQFHLKDREVIGKSQFEVFPSLHSDWRRIYERCLSGETRRGRETIRASHGPVEMRWEVRPWRNRSGQIGGVTIAFEEVWQPIPHQSSREKPETDERTFTAADLRSPALMVGLDGKVKDANEAAQPFLASFEESARVFCEELSALRAGEIDDVSLSHFENGADGRYAWTNTVRRDDVGQPVSVLRVGVLVPETQTQPLVAEIETTAKESADGGPRVESFEDEDLDLLPELIWKASSRGEITFFNAAWLKFRGRPLKSELNGGWLDGLHSDDARETKAVVAEAIREQKELRHKFRLKSDAGIFQTMIMWVQPFRQGGSGDVLGFIGNCRPQDAGASAAKEKAPAMADAVTSVAPSEAEVIAKVAAAQEEIAQLQTALAEAKTQSELPQAQYKAFQTSPALLFTCDARGALQTINRQWERFRGRSLGVEEGAGWLEGIADEAERQSVQRQLASAAEEGLPMKCRFHFSNHANEARLVELQATPLLDSEGLSTGMSGTVRDITDEYRTLTTVRDLIDPEGAEQPATAAELYHQLAAKLPQWKQCQGALSTDLATFREIFDSVGTGIVLLGPEGEALFANKRHREILGFGVEDAGDMESWLRRGCPDAEHAKAVLKAWQNDIWQRQLTKVLTLTTQQGVLREIEVQPQLFLNDNQLLLTILDVTESKRGEEALRDSEIRFRALFRDSAMGIALIDAESKIYDINPALERVLNTPRRQLLCRDFDACIHPEDLPHKRQLIEQLLVSPKRSAAIELRLARQNGDPEVWVRLHVSLVRDADQRVLFTAYFVQDITEQKALQAELQVSQEQNRALLESVPDLVMLVDRSGVLIDLLPSDEVPVNLPEGGDAIGLELDAIIPAFADKSQALIQQAYENDGVVAFGYTTEAGEFSARIVACKPDNVVINIQPSTAPTTAPEDVPESTRLQSLCFFNAADPVVITNYTGGIIDWNPAAEAFFGFTKQEALGQPLPQLFGCGSVEELTDRLTNSHEEEHRWEGRVSFTRKDGSFGDAEVQFQPLKSELGSLSGQVAFIREHRPETPTGPSPEELLEQAKNENLARMVPQMHQRLRNNLQIIGTLLNLQYKAQHDLGIRDALLAGRNRAFTLSLLHEQIQTKEDEESVDFLKFANRLAEQLIASFNAEGRVTITFQIVDTLDLQVASPLALILNELMSNAIQHGFPEPDVGEVVVALTIEPGKGMLSIRNNGVEVGAGVSENTGLGLQIVKTLARQIGGNLEKIDSTETDFRVYFTTALRK